MDVQTKGEWKKHVDRRDLCLAIFGNLVHPASDRQDVFKHHGHKMSGVIKGETVNANELF